MSVWVVARLPQRLKSMFFEKISHSATGSFLAAPLEIFSKKMLLLAFEANSANTWVVLRLPQRLKSTFFEKFSSKKR